MEGFFEKVKKVYIKVQAVCCFTSLLAPLSIVLAMVIFEAFPDMPDWLETVVGNATLVMYGLGLISALLACPVKWFALLAAMVIFGFTVGLPFLLVGAAIGAAIAVGLFGGLFLLIPAAVTIPHYFKEVRYNL